MPLTREMAYLASKSTNLDPVVEGPAISLAAPHIKVLREGTEDKELRGAKRTPPQ